MTAASIAHSSGSADTAGASSTATDSDVLVIGAGFGGIAAALRMRARGYSVTLVDRLQAIGGRAQVFERGGFRHDAGPTVITAPFLFDELFELFGERREDYLEFRPLDPWYRFHFDDGQQFDYRPGIEDTNNEIARSLNLSKVTIKHHLTSLRSNLGNKNRTHAVSWAIELGIS